MSGGAPGGAVRPRLVLAGGGHAHVEVLRRLARRPLPGAEVTLVTPEPVHRYSSRVPGYLQGTHALRALTIDLRALCAAAGARLVEATATALDGRELATSAGPLPYTHLSLDVGSAPAGLDDVPGAREHAIALRPVRAALTLRARLDALLSAPAGDAGACVHACVVGAGAAGVEIALALHRRIAAAGRTPRVTLVEREAHVLPEFAPAARARVARLLADRGVAVRTETVAARVDAGAVTLAPASFATPTERVAAQLVVWLAGAAPPPLLERAGLPRDARGFLRVDATLRSTGGAPVWGAGDCVALDGHPALPKAGVFAVRMGPVLAHNLAAAVGGGRPRAYVPQRAFLAILDTADGRALLRWRGLVTHGRVPRWLKAAIDARYLARYEGRQPEGDG